MDPSLQLGRYFLRNQKGILESQTIAIKFLPLYCVDELQTFVT